MIMGGGYHGGFGVSIPKESDYYVGLNGQALPEKFKHWIGVSRREQLLKRTKNDKLKKAISEMYRKGSFIGDGGTASVLKFEKRTGTLVSPKGHYQKAIEMMLASGRKSHFELNKNRQSGINKNDQTAQIV